MRARIVLFGWVLIAWPPEIAENTTAPVFAGNKNLESPLFGYNINAGEGTPSDVRALFALAPNTDWFGVGDYLSITKTTLQDCANYAVQNNGDGFVYHGNSNLC